MQGDTNFADTNMTADELWESIMNDDEGAENDEGLSEDTDSEQSQEEQPADDTSGPAQEEQAAPEADPQDTNAGNADVTPPTPDPEPMHTIRYRDTDHQLTQAQLIEFAQKGMDYEGVRADRDAMRLDRPLADFVKELAANENVDPMLYLAQARQRLNAAAVERAKSEGMTKSQAQEHVRQAKELAHARNQLAVQRAQQANQMRIDQQRSAFQTFFMQNPNVRPDQLPGEVLAAVSKGTPIDVAYRAHEHNQVLEQNNALTAQLEALKTSKAAQNAAPASVSSDSAKAPPDDEIWNEFMKN